MAKMHIQHFYNTTEHFGAGNATDATFNIFVFDFPQTAITHKLSGKNQTCRGACGAMLEASLGYVNESRWLKHGPCAWIRPGERLQGFLSVVACGLAKMANRVKAPKRLHIVCAALFESS